jgi:cysteinyl-tRNA synthetase
LAAAGFTRAEFLPPVTQETQTAWGRFQHAWEVLQNDLNVPGCLGQVFTVLADKEEPAAGQARQDLSGLAKLLYALGLTLFTAAPVAAAPAEVVALADQRWAAKQAKDFAAADRLRQELTALGWAMLDRKDGYDLKKA